MRNRLLGLLVVTGLTTFTVSAVPAAIQNAPATNAGPQLPPIQYTCPMHPEVLEEKPGTCPICKMNLEQVRIDSKWWCPVHQSLAVRDAPGKCPIDRQRDMVQVILSEYFTCPGSDNKLMDPGKCADGSARKIKYEVRAHGDHNPKHGGSFFMAEDQWHHVEGTYVNGLFKVYFYDNFTKPMPAKDFTGQLVLQDKMFKDVESWPLKLGADGVTMEARVPADKAALPLNLAARISFGPGQKSNLFNFPFTKYSVEPTAAPATGGAGGRPLASRVELLGTIASIDPKQAFAGLIEHHVDHHVGADLQVGSDAGLKAGTYQTRFQDPSMPQQPRILDSPVQISAELAAALDESRLPATTPELVKTLESRTKEIEALVKEGSLGQAWLPAMGTKTVAIVLADKAKDLPEAQQAIASSAAKQIVNSAWEIDAYGDLGNQEKLNEAFQRLSAAVNEMKGVYATSR